MTPLDQAIYDSSYALTERERHIAEHFWKARDKEIADLKLAILSICQDFQTDDDCVKAIDLIHGLITKK